MALGVTSVAMGYMVFSVLILTALEAQSTTQKEGHMAKRKGKYKEQNHKRTADEIADDVYETLDLSELDKIEGGCGAWIGFDPKFSALMDQSRMSHVTPYDWRFGAISHNLRGGYTPFTSGIWVQRD
jgi:hypothetical protein